MLLVSIASMKTKELYILGILSAIIVTALCLSLQAGEERIRQETDHAFCEATARHYSERIELFQHFTHPGLNPYSEYYITAPVYDRKIKKYTLRTWKDRTVFVFKDSVDEAKARRLLNEHILTNVHPIDADKLNILFRARLAARNICGQTGTIYYNEQERHSSSDTLSASSAYSTPVYRQDITGDIQAQGWVAYDTVTLLRYIDRRFFLLIALIALGTAICYYLRKRSNASHIYPDISVNMEKQELIIDGILCPLPKLDLALFCLLLRKKGRCVSREEIKQRFWKTDTNADEKIDTHIKILRKHLKGFPEYQIVTVRGQGYYLSVKKGS